MKRIVRVDELSDQLLTALEGLYRSMAPEERSVFNDPCFLRACWQSFAAKDAPFCLLYKDEDSLLAAAMFRRETVRLAGRMKRMIVPLVYRASDFTDFPAVASEREAFLNALIAELLSWRENVLLPNLTERDHRLLPAGTGRWSLHMEVKNPVCRDSGDEFKDVIRKKSLVRHTNWFKKNGELRITHQRGGVAPEKFSKFVALHKERWRYQDIESKFHDPSLVDLYGRLCSGYGDDQADPSVVFTEVAFDGNPIAMHVGFRWGGTFLYQVPAINLEFLERSPGEVLMRSLFEYALQEGLQCFDLGYGEEDYKARLANDCHVYRTYVLFRSGAGRLTAGARRMIGRSALCSTAAAIARRGLRAARRTCRSQRIIVSTACGEPAADEQDVIEMDFAAYVRYCRQVQNPPYPLKPHVYKRFREGYRLFALSREGAPVSFVWMTGRRRVYASEVNATLEAVAREACWIVDGITLPEHRRHGFYPELLRKVASLCEGRQVLLYSLVRNKPSRKGIARACFEDIAQVTRGLMGVRVVHLDDRGEMIRLVGSGANVG